MLWIYQSAFFILTVESRPYGRTDRYTNESYTDSGGRIYGTIIDRKCNCTKVVKQALSHNGVIEAEEEETDSYRPPTNYKPNRKTTPKRNVYVEEDYEEEYEETRTTPKKSYRKQTTPAANYEEEEEETYQPIMKSKPKPYRTTPTYTEPEEPDEEYEPVTYAPKRKTTQKPAYKKVSVYQETTAEERYEEAGDYTKEKPVRKPKPYKTTKEPEYTTDNEEEEENYGTYEESAGYSGKSRPKPRPNEKRPPKTEEYDETEEMPKTYEKSNSRGRNSTSNTYKTGKNSTSGAYKTEKQQRLDLSDSVTEEDAEIDPDEYVYKKPTKPASAYKPPKYGEKTTEKNYGRPEIPPKAPSYRPNTPETSDNQYKEDNEEERIDYDIESRYDGAKSSKTNNTADRHQTGKDYETRDRYATTPSQGYKKSEQPYHKMTTHLTRYATHKPPYATTHHHIKPTEAAQYSGKDNNVDNYVNGSSKPSVVTPKVITVHQNASRETGILIRLVDPRSKAEPAPVYDRIN